MILLAVRFTEERLPRHAEHSLGISLRDTLIGSCFSDAASTLEYAVRTDGKPYVKNAPVSYSISHTDGCVLCAVSVPCVKASVSLLPPDGSALTDGMYMLSCEGDPCELGVDIELIRESLSTERMKALAERYFSTADAEHLADAKHEARLFFSLWTKYESIVKCTGEGLSSMRRVAMRHTSSDSCDSTYSLKSFSFLNGERSFALSLCTSKGLSGIAADSVFL